MPKSEKATGNNLAKKSASRITSVIEVKNHVIQRKKLNIFKISTKYSRLKP